jgi:hypothetical protein
MLDTIKAWIQKIFKPATPGARAVATASATDYSAPAVGVGPGDVPLGGLGAGLIAIYLILVASASFTFLLWSWPTLEAGCRHDEAAITEAPTPPASVGQTAAFKLDSISPDSGSMTGGTAVRLRGKNFPANPIVLFDDFRAKVTTGQATVIIVRTPSHSLGPVNVEVNNGGTQSATLSAAYTYICPDGYELKLFGAALLAGILGGSLHAMRSLIWYRGNKTLVRSWTLRYLLLPFTGGIIAVAFYLLVQVGLFTPQNGTGSLLILGIAVLVGMFSEQATEKLRKIAEALLTEAPKGANQTPPVEPATAVAGTATPKNYSVEPEIGFVDGKDLVVLTGPGLSAGTTMTLGGQAVAGRLAGSALAFNAPANPAGRVDLVITNPGQTPVTLSNAYLYTPVLPVSGPKAGNTKITITGAGFTNTASVTIGGAPAQGVTFIDAGTLEAVTPQATKEGIAALKVTDGANVLLDLPEAFKYTP